MPAKAVFQKPELRRRRSRIQTRPSRWLKKSDEGAGGRVSETGGRRMSRRMTTAAAGDRDGIEDEPPGSMLISITGKVPAIPSNDDGPAEVGDRGRGG